MPFVIDPPLLNSSNPWATTFDDLDSLYRCTATGAVTTRTCTLTGFNHEDNIHQYTFFDPATSEPVSKDAVLSRKSVGSLNTLGYSPLPLSETLANIEHIWKQIQEEPGVRRDKMFVVSVTGSADEVAEAYDLIGGLRSRVGFPLAMEVNMSCPNIAGKPPPAYSQAELTTYLTTLSVAASRTAPPSKTPFGIKLPPYSDPNQFLAVKHALLRTLATTPDATMISFITATNTLGCSFVMSPSNTQALNSADGSGMGGMAGAPLHPLALGNVKALRSMLDGEAGLKGIMVIGVGGVSDRKGFDRMRSAGAYAVGVGTALGLKGVAIFGEIIKT